MTNEKLTAAKLRAELLSLVPDRCQREGELCPWLARTSLMWTVGFDNMHPAFQQETYDRAIALFANTERECSFGIGTEVTFSGEQPKCRRGEVCGGLEGTPIEFPGMQSSSLTA